MTSLRVQRLITLLLLGAIATGCQGQTVPGAESPSLAATLAPSPTARVSESTLDGTGRSSLCSSPELPVTLQRLGTLFESWNAVDADDYAEASSLMLEFAALADQYGEPALKSGFLALAAKWDEAMTLLQEASASGDLDALASGMELGNQTAEDVGNLLDQLRC